ncbi:MAG TPA: trypsin-like peptidase domain-containing protein [Jatrophihabitans sp.]|nr:trypsin-like peptidase domain-containing protein [Jatrophihabitans sp.]
MTPMQPSGDTPTADRSPQDPGAPQAEQPAGTAHPPPAGTAHPPAAGEVPPDVRPPAGSPPGRRRFGPVLVAALVAALVGAGVASGTYAAFDHDSTTVRGVAAPVSPGTGTVASAAAAISPSVVTINTSGGSASGTGSGFVLRSQGYVVTNDHVVTLDGGVPASAATIGVTLSGGKQVPATVVGTDPGNDLAVIKLSDGGSYPAATVADSSTLVVGQSVVAVGAPLGLSNTVTSGIVSALARPVQAGNNGQAIFNAVQTDAAINPGNSGGPLVDLAGRVIGVNSAIATAGSSGSGQSGSIGIGFAIPSNEVSRIANELIDTGHATHATLGVSVSATSGTQSGGPTSAAGATVEAVTPGGPAAKAGLAVGDVITAVGKQRVDDSTGLIAAVRSYPPGTAVPLTVSRNGTTSTVTVTLGSTPS